MYRSKLYSKFLFSNDPFISQRVREAPLAPAIYDPSIDVSIDRSARSRFEASLTVKASRRWCSL